MVDRTKHKAYLSQSLDGLVMHFQIVVNSPERKHDRSYFWVSISKIVEFDDKGLFSQFFGLLQHLHAVESGDVVRLQL